LAQAVNESADFSLQHLVGTILRHDLIGWRGGGLMSAGRVVLPLVVAVAAALASLALVPLALEADRLLSIADDPAAIADHAVGRALDAPRAEREIEAALAARDTDLAGSFLDLARDRGLPVDPALASKVEAATAEAASAARQLENFARGFVTGEPEDAVGLAGTVVGDLFLFGDIRDAVREGTRLAAGEPADELILGLACVGIAVTAGTYAALGTGAPARVGLTAVKAARKTGRLGADMAAWLSRTLRDVVDWSKFRAALGPASLTQPASVARAARVAVKADKAESVVKLVGDLGRVQAKAGTQAALDALKIAQGPRDVARISRLAAAKGGKTRAILKVAGRGAIMLTVGTFNLAMWMFWAAFAVLSFVTGLKRMVERIAERGCARRRLRRARAAAAALAQNARAASAELPIIVTTAPTLVPQLAGAGESGALRSPPVAAPAPWPAAPQSA
jgi:hypothetical protein